MFFLLTKSCAGGAVNFQTISALGATGSSVALGANLAQQVLFRSGYRLGSDATPGQELGVGIEVSAAGDQITVTSDFAGREPIFFSRCAGGFTVSNSFAVLISCLKEAGQPVTPHQAVIDAQSSDSWIFETAAFHSTMVEGVQICPASHFVRISMAAGAVQIVKQDAGALEHGYEDGLDQTATYLRSCLKLLLENHEFPILSLSGGQDSRILLAAAMSLDSPARKNLLLHSIKSQSEEYAIVEKIAKKYGFPLNVYPQKTRVVKLEPESAARRWILANLGVCFRNNYSDKYLVETNAILIRGGQVHASYYPIVLRKWLRDIRRVSEQKYLLYSGLMMDSALPNLQVTLDSHYQFFRYRFHYGLTGYAASIGPLTVDPLINPFYERLATLLDFDARESGNLCRDLCNMMEPDVLSFGFAKGKNVTGAAGAEIPQQVRRSPASAFVPMTFSNPGPAKAEAATGQSSKVYPHQIVDAAIFKDMTVSQVKKFNCDYIFGQR